MVAYELLRNGLIYFTHTYLSLLMNKKLVVWHVYRLTLYRYILFFFLSAVELARGSPDGATG